MVVDGWKRRNDERTGGQEWWIKERERERNADIEFLVKDSET